MNRKNLFSLTFVLGLSGVVACSGGDSGEDNNGTDTGDNETGGGDTDAGTDLPGEDTPNADTTGEDTPEGDTAPGDTDVPDGTGDGSCDDDTQCAEGESCEDGVCTPLVAPEDYVFADTWSYVWQLQFPVREAPCCFDYDSESPAGDADIDNALGQLVSALGPLLGGDTDLQGTLDDSIAEGDISILLEYREIPADLTAGGPVRLSVFLGDNDGDGDGEPDQTWEARGEGAGVFTAQPESFGDAGSQVQFNHGNVADSTMNAGPSVFRLSIPIPDLFELDLTIEEAIMEADIERTATGIGSVDFDVDVDGETISFGGAKLGGVVPLPQVINVLDDLARDCATCGGFDGTQPVFQYAENADTGSFDISCAQDVSGASACTDEDGFLCPNLGTVCGAAGIVGSLADVDTNDNDVNDALSVGLYMKLAGADVTGITP